MAGPLTVVQLELPFDQPLAHEPLLRWFRARATDGVVEVEGATLRRTLRLPGGPARVALTLGTRSVHGRFELSEAGDAPAAVARARRLLDLDADPVAIDGHLATDPALRPLVRARPGLRVPGSADPHEMALLTVIGQQISTAAARTIASRLVARITAPEPALVDASGGAGADAVVDVEGGGDGPGPDGSAGGERTDPSRRPSGGPFRLFPPVEVVAEADLDGLGMPRRRAATVGLLATALAEGRIDLGDGCDRDDARARLLALPGVGPWTADYILLRAVGDPDALPATDLVLRQRALERGIDLAVDPEAWRPWRAYAAQHLWVAEAGPAPGPG